MLVWAFQELKELDGQTGFVECDDKVGVKLLKAEKVQSPNIGALDLKAIKIKKPRKTKAE